MTVLKQYIGGSWQPIIAGVQGPQGIQGDWTTAQTVNTQTGTSYTVDSSDNGKLITLSNSSSINLVVNTGLNLAAGHRIDFIQLGTGRITVTGTATVNSANGKITRTQYSAATLICVGTNTYVLVGDTLVA